MTPLQQIQEIQHHAEWSAQSAHLYGQSVDVVLVILVVGLVLLGAAYAIAPLLDALSD
jgi:hypothetical protein